MLHVHTKQTQILTKGEKNNTTLLCVELKVRLIFHTSGCSPVKDDQTIMYTPIFSYTTHQSLYIHNRRPTTKNHVCSLHTPSMVALD
jgi:hypothetical protein